MIGTVATVINTSATGANEIAKEKKLVFTTWHSTNTAKLRDRKISERKFFGCIFIIPISKNIIPAKLARHANISPPFKLDKRMSKLSGVRIKAPISARKIPVFGFVISVSVHYMVEG